LGASEVGGGQIPYAWVAAGGFVREKPRKGRFNLYFFSSCGSVRGGWGCDSMWVVFDPYLLFYAG